MRECFDFAALGMRDVLPNKPTVRHHTPIRETQQLQAINSSTTGAHGKKP
jgi:hypothetical protein